MLLGLLVMIFGASVLSSYDARHRTTIECTVTDADGGRATAGGRAASSFYQVLISTSDCGTLTLIEGINPSNRESVAAELSSGDRVSIVIGEGTESLRKTFNTLGITPEIQSFEKID